MKTITTPLYFEKSDYLDCSHYWYLEDNIDSENLTYEEVIDFLMWDKTDKLRWIEGEWMCLDFNIRVHNLAELNGLRCGFVKLYDIDTLAGHVCLAWQTVDEGLIYTDSTGVMNPDFHRGSYDSILEPMEMHELTGYYIDNRRPITYEYIVEKIKTYW
jgi:hypothetical protein